MSLAAIAWRLLQAFGLIKGTDMSVIEGTSPGADTPASPPPTAAPAPTTAEEHASLLKGLVSDLAGIYQAAEAEAKSLEAKIETAKADAVAFGMRVEHSIASTAGKLVTNAEDFALKVFKEI